MKMVVRTMNKEKKYIAVLTLTSLVCSIFLYTHTNDTINFTSEMAALQVVKDELSTYSTDLVFVQKLLSALLNIIK